MSWCAQQQSHALKHGPLLRCATVACQGLQHRQQTRSLPLGIGLLCL